MKKVTRVSKLFENQVVFITGAAHGQGRATALAFAKEGARVVGFDVAKKLSYPSYSFGTSEELQSLQQEIKELGSEALIFAGDVRNDDDIKLAVDETIKQFGQIDVLFNNAGICAYGLAHELTEKNGTRCWTLI